MKTLLVVDAESDRPHVPPELPVATAKEYLTTRAHATAAYERVVNLCDTRRPNGPGYYVSLLAEARGHAAVPTAKAIADQRTLARGRTAQAARRPASRAARHPAIAILYTPGEPLPPSDPAALQAFIDAADRAGLRAELIDRHAIGRLDEFDALFLRDTTWVGHHTYEFAHRAEALGLVVIDDAASILRCSDKAFLNELLTRNGLPVPQTMMVHRDNAGAVAATLGLPCILKEPVSGFSLGVRKADTAAALERETAALLEKSALLVAQRYVPTAFDWRVAVLDRRVLYVCKYFMAPGHWQVHKYEPGCHLEGCTCAIPVDEAPRAVVDTALRAANLIGDGLYGVDLKEAGDRCCVIEINDNPSIESQNEDGVLGEALYRGVMDVFARRIRERRRRLAAAA